MTANRHIHSVVLTLIGLIFMTACSESEAPQQQAPSMPPPTVTVAEVVSREIADWENFTGRLEAAKEVALRPRVSGYIEQVAFEEGALVEKGDLLFRIDPKPFETEVQRLEAELESARAQIGLAKRDATRAESLRHSNAISEEQLDNRNTQLTKAQADAASVRAALENARLNLGYTRVTAPISGRVSRANITEGNYVAQGQSVLTSLVSTDRVHAYFDVDEQTYLRLRAHAGQIDIGESGIPVFMSLVNDAAYPHQGNIDFVDNQVDISTGTIRLRAVFENKENQFTPGMFVRLKMRIGQPYQGVLVDEMAIGTDLSNKYVLVLGDDNVVAYRPVKLGPRVGTLRVIKSGLSAGDVIVTNGLQRARPGTPVTPEKKDMASEAQLQSIHMDAASAEENVPSV